MLDRLAEIADARFLERVSFLPIPGLDISSPDLRRRVREGRGIRYMTPDAVQTYIARRGLYRPTTLQEEGMRGRHDRYGTTARPGAPTAEAVQRITAALYTLTDVDALQRMALQTAMDVVEADAGSLLVYDAEKNALIFRHVVGPVADTLDGTTLELAHSPGIAGQVFRTGVSRLTRNVDEDTDHVGTVDARTGYHTHSLMTVPLRRRDGGQPYGIVQLVNKRSGDFDEGDVAVTEIMGSLVVMAVQNVLLAQRARLAAVAYSVGEISHDIGNMLTYVLPYVQTLDAYIADVRAGRPGAQDALETFYQEVVTSVADGVEQVESRAKEIARAVKGEVAPLVFEPGRPLRTAQHVARAFAATAGRHQVLLAADGRRRTGGRVRPRPPLQRALQPGQQCPAGDAAEGPHHPHRRRLPP